MAKKEVAASAGGDLTIPKDWREELAKSASDTAATVRPTSSTISLRAGMVMYQGVEAPNNQIDVVVLGFAQEHTLYLSPYDADNPSSPDCYALAASDTEEEDVIPAENVPEPISTNCHTCKYLKWGSDLKGGRGKACQQRRRLIAIPASSLESADAVLGAEVATVKLPVTSGKIWDSYVQSMASIHQRPPWALVTTLSAKPDAKTQFKAVFTPKEAIDFDAQPELYQAIRRKIELSDAILMRGYDMSGEAEEEPVADNAKLK